VQLLPSEIPASLETKFVVEIGGPAERILKVAAEQSTDLIVMGPHHSSFAQVSAHLPWVTPHQVLCHASCPVLTVKDLEATLQPLLTKD
jgi:nucleotide-binding universal stress UspA family protein